MTYRKILTPLESNFKVDSISHYRESITVQYLMYITRHKAPGSMTCYPVYIVSPWISVYNLIRWKLLASQDYLYHPQVSSRPIVWSTNMP